MYKAVYFSILFMSIVSLSAAHSEDKLPYGEAPYNDTVIQCGAVFALVADGYGGLDQPTKERKYRDKVGKLLKQSEDEFLKVGRSKKEVQDLHEERVVALTSLLEKDKDFTVRHIRFCDQKFP